MLKKPWGGFHLSEPNSLSLLKDFFLGKITLRLYSVVLSGVFWSKRGSRSSQDGRMEVYPKVFGHLSKRQLHLQDRLVRDLCLP